MREKMPDNNIGEKTRIPLFAVMVALPTIFTSVFWLSSLSARTELVDQKNKEQDAILLKVSAKLDEINDRTIRIETNLRRGK